MLGLERTGEARRDVAWHEMLGLAWLNIAGRSSTKQAIAQPEMLGKA